MAKFKVGDKVRVRENLIVGGVYGTNTFVKYMEKYKGRILTISFIDSRGYELEEADYYWTDEMLEEVKEDKMEKTFKEVIRDIKEGEVWVGCEYAANKPVIKIEFGAITIGFGAKTDGYKFWEDTKFKLKRKEYTFEEAFKAYEEGKEIESVYSGYRYKKENGEDVAILSADWQDFDYFELYEIRGKWYIND